MYQLLVQSPIGPLTISGDGGALTSLKFGDALERDAAASPLLERAAQELAEYFSGQRRDFTLPMSPAGTPFQRKVWHALCGIPYGRTATYGEIAARTGDPKACRAVGMANNRNPLPIFIPCHRVVGAGGQLTGYAGGLRIKKMLLDLEAGGAAPASSRPF